MSSEEFSLTWDDHHSTLVGVFEKLLETSTLVDCTIAAEGQYLKAHKIILSACSPYFELLFRQENEKNPIVVLKDIKFQELKAMIDFIYSGKVKVPEDRLGDFVDAAESLQIKGLGGDSQKNTGSGKLPSQRPLPQREGSIPRKRRCTFLNTREDNASEVSLNADVTVQNDGTKSVSIHNMEVDKLAASGTDSISIVKATTNSSALPTGLHSDQTDPSLSFEDSPDESEDILPSPESVIVKSETDPLAEVSFPEIDCFVQSKDEEDIEEASVLDSGGGDSGSTLGDANSQHTTRPFCGSSPSGSKFGQKSSPRSTPYIQNIQQFSYDLHVPVLGTYRRCAMCSNRYKQKRSRIICKACNKALCLTCFKPFHASGR